MNRTMQAPAGWSAPTNLERHEWIETLGLIDAHKKLAIGMFFVMVPLLADAGFIDAAYTLDTMAMSSARQLLAATLP